MEVTYSIVQPKIQQWVDEDPNRLRDVIQFVSLTIRQPFYTMKSQMSSVKKDGARSPYLWGHKIKTYQWLNDNQDSLPSMYNAIKRLTDEESLSLLIAIPGIGLAKGGFILQIVNGSVGCIDSHNIRVYNNLIGNLIKDNPKGFIKGSLKGSILINDSFIKRLIPLGYISICNHLGTEALWDNWCQMISDKYPKHFKDADDVSMYHYECLLK